MNKRIMKHFFLLTIAAVGALALTACTSSENMNSMYKDEGAVSTGSNENGSAGSAEQNEAGQNTASQDYYQEEQNENAYQGTAPAEGTSDNDPVFWNDNVTVDDGSQQEAAEAGDENVIREIADIDDTSDEDEGTADEVTVDDTYSDDQMIHVVDEIDDETDSEDSWSGTYEGEQETVTLTYLGEDEVSFSFTQAGIRGTAEAEGNQAVYQGDDHHVIVFTISGNTLEVAVLNEEDYDVSESPLIGAYVKK